MDNINLDVSLQNVVCCFHTKCHIKLKDFCMKATNVEHVREHGLVRMRLRSPRTTSSIWASGKISVTGAKSEADARKAARRVGRILQRAGYDVKLTNYRIVNILAKCRLPFEVRLDSFANANRNKSQYEPELQPQVVVQMGTPKATINVFSTGSVTITTDSVHNLSTALMELYPMVEPHKIIVPTPVIPTTYTSLPSYSPVTTVPNNGRYHQNGNHIRSQPQLRNDRRPIQQFTVERVECNAVQINDIEEEEGYVNGNEISRNCNFSSLGAPYKKSDIPFNHLGDRRGLKRRQSCEESLGLADDLKSGSASQGS